VGAGADRGAADEVVAIAGEAAPDAWGAVDADAVGEAASVGEG